MLWEADYGCMPARMDSIVRVDFLHMEMFEMWQNEISVAT